MTKKLFKRIAKRCGRVVKDKNADQDNVPFIFRLPAELRSQIWALTLPRDSVLIKTHPYVQVSAILRTNRQIRQEAFSMWFTCWKVKINVVNCDAAFSMISTKCYSVLYDHALRSGLVSHKDQDLVVPPGLVFRGPPSWSNLVQFLAVLHTHDFDREQAAPDPGQGNGEIIDSAMCIMARVRQRPWTEIEKVLEMFHRAVSARDATCI